MIFEQTLSIVLALIPLIVGVVCRVPRISMANLKSIGLVTIGILGAGVILIGSVFETDPSIMLLTGAVLLSGFCGLVGQEGTREGSAVCASTLIVLGLGLGVLLNQGLVDRLFLIGLLGYIAVALNREKRPSVRTKMIFAQVAIAVALTLSSIFTGETVRLFAGLFLAVTFLPLAPFHLPFVSMLERAKGTLPSFWIVVWLTIGLAELQAIHSSLTADVLLALGLLALASAVYASLACLGQQKSNLFVASATVAHVALVWGLLGVFSSYSKWGIPFGVAVALVMGGGSLAFSFVRQRYGWQTIGKLPGLASPMPRFGTIMLFLVSFAVFLPLFPTFSGLKFMTTAVTHDVGIILILSTFLVVWLGGGWYFSRMLHETAFGKARPDVPYTDLRAAEFMAVSALLVCAAYSGLIH